ncbi:MAG: PDZ domain-containing protein [Muribaculaceae bacterium]|nr:PDZ domain-containing protein [Muribaculaceae bacterium]
MKKSFYFLSAIFACLFLVSCDANKGKVADMAEKFIKAVSEKDKVTVYQLYPALRNMDLLVFPTTLPDDIDVEFDETDSVYVAKLGDEKSLIVEVYGEDKLQIIDSYKVFKLDSLTYELAAKIGAPVNSKSDMWNGKYFDDDSHFISWLGSNSGKILSTDQGYYTWWGSGRTEITQRVTNHSKHTFNWDEYSIQFEFKNRKTGEIVGTHTETGLTLAPGESRTIEFRKDALYQTARKSQLSWKGGVKVVFKEKYQAHAYAKFGEFKGDEYSRHINRVQWGFDWTCTTEEHPEYDEEYQAKAKELGITKGLLMTNIYPNSCCADDYGFKQWDAILEIDGQSVTDGVSWNAWKEGKKKGDTAKFKIIRDKKEMILDVVLTNKGDTIPAQ